MFSKLLQFLASNKAKVIRLFQIWYLLWAAALILATWATVTENPIWGTIISWAMLAGKSALCLFIVVTLPGILGRFRFKHPLITIGIMFRRHLGISTFLLAMFHALVLFYIPTLAFGGSLLSFERFQLFGSLALFCLIPLAATSNDWSVKKLGPNWKRLHKLVYLIFWLIFLHVAFQGKRQLMYVIGIAGVLEVASLIFDAVMKRKPAVSPQATSTPTAPPVLSSKGDLV